MYFKSIALLLTIIAYTSTLHSQTTTELLITQGNYQEVIDLLGSDNVQTNAKQRYHLAIAYQKSGYLKEAIDCLLTDSASLTKTQTDLLCRCYLKTGNYSKALTICMSTYESNPKDVSNIIRLAEINNHYKDYIENIELLSTYTKTDSLNYNINLLLAESYQRAEVFDEAIKTFQLILSHYPDNEKIALKLARLYYSKKKYVECHDLCVPFIEKLDNNKNFLLTAGLANFKNKSNHNVLVMFNRLEARGDSSFLTKKHLGFTYYRLENYEKTVTYLQAAMEYKDDDPEVAYFLGSAYAQGPHPIKGITYLELAQELIKPSPALMEKSNNKLGDIFYLSDNYTAAVSCYEEAFVYAPENPIYMYRIASIYDHKLNEPTKAIKLYEDFLAALPESLDPKSKKGSEVYAFKLKEIATNRLTTMKENEFFTYGH